ncbi:hypothetical protein B0T26DRAFT_873806 [Lasiosphaeria miniovina]|uniref:Ankyrin repeat protein n=1 Tax=Lasiosphaeria miniovina TaxID=1954250 RepID=A0AA40DUK4_9PEZI|nr:uncharacterized protein B0T26DRAFT_873806 [Lasiosphaeria miniovina]KAK0713751.1 hypothetical protein B0T26DRAFT_873806 [Lasiosphaeria miniovina]
MEAEDSAPGAVPRSVPTSQVDEITPVAVPEREPPAAQCIPEPKSPAANARPIISINTDQAKFAQGKDAQGPKNSLLSALIPGIGKRGPGALPALNTASKKPGDLKSLAELLSPQDGAGRGSFVPKTKPRYRLDPVAPGSNLRPSVDIIAVHDFEETAEDAWTFEGGLLLRAPRSNLRDPSERDRESSRGSHDRRRRPDALPKASATPNDGLLGTEQPELDSKGKALEANALPGQRDPKLKVARKEVKDKSKLADGSIRSARSSSEFPDRREKRQETVNWLRDFIPRDIPQSRVLSFSYPRFDKKSHISLVSYVEKAATELLQRVKRSRQGELYENVPIIFIGYGFGGIVIQKAIQLAVQEAQAWDEAAAKPVPFAEKEVFDPNLDGKEKAQVTSNGDQRDVADEKSQKPKASLANKPPDLISPFPIGDISQLLLLDTPFPGKPDTKASKQLFPANVNIRVTQILQWIESQEKGPKLVEKVWADFQRVRGQLPQSFALSWLYSQTRGRQTEGDPQKMKDEEHPAADVYGISFKSISTYQHRRLGRIPDAQDYVYRGIMFTIRSELLFQALAAQNVSLVSTIVDGKTRGVIKDKQGRTPLHAAALLYPPNEDIVTILVTDCPSDAVEGDDMGCTPLHLAVDSAWQNEPDEGMDRAGYRGVIRCLVRNMPVDLDIEDNDQMSPWAKLCDRNECTCRVSCDWIWDLRDNPEPISGPAIAEDLEEPTRPEPPVEGSLEEAVMFASQGIVSEFYHAVSEKTKRLEEHITWKTTSIHEMIYDHDRGCAKILEVSRAKREGQDFRCRWIHVPANNEQWLYDLFLSIGVRDLSMTDQRYDGRSIFNRYMNPQVKKVDHNKIDIRAPEIPTWIPGISETSFQPPGTTNPQAHSLPTVLEDPGAGAGKVARPKMPPTMSDGRKASEILARYVYWEDLPPVKDPGRNKTIALFMPFLAYESHQGRRAMAREIKQDLRSEIAPLNDSGSLLGKARTRPIHYRRTLDQYSYYMLDSTERRDKDQVMYRWATKQQDRVEKKHAPILMVDQLWLWALPDGTVITSIPNTNKVSEPFNIQRILGIEIQKNKRRHAIKGPESIFDIVLKTCVNAMKRPGPGGVKLQECFQSSINKIAESEAVKMKTLLDTVKKLAKAKDPFKLTADIDSFSKISKEMYQLVEIIDIQDELAIINSVLAIQRSVLKDLRDHFCSEDKPKTDPESNRPPSTVAITKGVVDESIRIVDENIRGAKEMTESARRVHQDLKQLLEFKQQQANGWESRYAMKLSEQGQRQNTIMLTFTIVTIIFLPLSFISSFFAIGIKEFPKDEETGNQAWPIAEVSAYMFGISVGVSLVILLFVLLFFARRSKSTKKFVTTSKQQLGLSRDKGRQDALSEQLDDHDDDPDDDTSSELSDDDEKDNLDGDGDGNTGREARGDAHPYAPLFNRWRWHSRIPGLRRLWLWGPYEVPPERRHNLRSQEQVEFDYPLHRLRHRVPYFLRNSLRPSREPEGPRYSFYNDGDGQHDDGGDNYDYDYNYDDDGDGNGEGNDSSGNGDGDDYTCHSIDERARREELEMEHHERVQERKDWLASLFGIRSSTSKSRGPRDGEAGEDAASTTGGDNAALPESAGPGVPSLVAGMFRKRNRQAGHDEERGPN